MPDTIAPKPCSRIILQAADGSEFYSLPWDASASLVLLPGTGIGTATHNGATYTFAASDPAATVTPANPTKYEPGWTKLTLTPADDISAALAVAGEGAELTLAPGNYAEVLKLSVPSA